MQLLCIIKEFRELFKENYSDLKHLVANIKNTDTRKLILNDCDLSKQEEYTLMQYIREYKAGKPIDKIIHESGFYGYKFFINDYVLSPRIDTEIVIDAVCSIKNKEDKFCILDLCTGSGIILITLLLEFKNSFGIGIDVSDEALLVSNKNAVINTVNDRCVFFKNDILAGLNLKNGEKYDIVVSNPPYIKSADIKNLDQSVQKYDPRIALDGGEDGTIFYEKILTYIKPFINQDSVIIFEIGYDIEFEVKKIIELNGFYVVNEYKDIQNITRVLAVKAVST